MDKSLQNTVKRLDKKLVDLFEDLKDYTDISLNKQPSEAWSVLEIMQHLMLAERQSVTYIQGKIDDGFVFDQAGMGANFRSFFLNTTLSLPIKFNAPYSMGKDAFHEYTTFWEVVKEWRESRTELKAFLKNLPPEAYEQTLYKHPIGGKLTVSGMLSFYEKHFDRHLKQIRKTLKAIDAVKQI